MSLRVWLPLTGDLRNNGLSDVTVTNNGATVDNSGKLGKCYYFNASNQNWIQMSMPTEMKTIKNTTVCAWVKSTSSTLALGGISHNGSNNLAGVTLYSSGWQISGQGSSWKYVSAGTIANTSVWHHTCCTIGDDVITTYLDGVKVATSSLTTLGIVTTDISSYNYLEIGCDHPGGDEYMTGYINDFRIYDHALSPKEVKLLSQGLVCHYKLDDPYIEGTTNTVTTTDCLSATCYNASRRKYGYGENTDMYKTMGFFEGKYCTKVYMGTSGELANPYPYISGNATVSDGTNAPEYKTVSFDYFGTIGTYIQPYKLGDGSATCTWTNKSASTQTGTYTNSGQIPVVPNKWNHITMVLHGTTAANAAWGYIILGAAHTSDTANYWLFANLQIEEKDHETPYAGVGGTRNEPFVLDSSGYNNHAQTWHYDEYGAIVSTSDTTRNSIATYINSESATTDTASGTWMIYGNCGLTTPNTLTVALWCKPFAGYGGNVNHGLFCLTSNNIGLSAATDYNTSAMHNRDGYIDMCNSSGTHKNPTITIVKNEWHHYAVAYDGRYGKIYRDATELTTIDMGSVDTLKTFTAIVLGYSHAGGVSRKNKSYYSDFRLYATALSAEDIQQLYNTPVSVANTGAMMTQGEFVEVVT